MADRLTTIKKTFAEGAHAHAYLFWSGTAAERTDAARALAETLTGHAADARNPDVLHVIPEKESGIAIAAVRDIGRFLALASYFGNGKVVILEEADRMEESAASALLKLLEEPPAGSVLFLLAEGVGSVMPTILSRVQKIRIDGGPVVRDIDKNKKIFYSLKSVLSARSDADRLQIAERLAKEEQVALSDLMPFLRDLVLVAGGCPELAGNRASAAEMEKIFKQEKRSPKEFAAAVAEVLRIEHALRTTNVNRRLAWENALLSL